ncbi:MAG: hypothetical protein PF508_14005 [Spirochaeta sp.]|jgi:hypothetical protein|nr:hypothetical protein [Spirochaeta sp.]
MMDTEYEIRNAVKDLQMARSRLSERFTHWKFTLDGNLVGDIGEAYAFAHFDMTKIGTGTKNHDFVASDDKHVQVKMTQRKTLGLGLKEPAFDYLIALFLGSDGEIEVLYNGPGAPIYTRPGKPPRRSIPTEELRERNRDVDDADRVPLRALTGS